MIGIFTTEEHTTGVQIYSLDYTELRMPYVGGLWHICLPTDLSTRLVITAMRRDRFPPGNTLPSSAALK